MPLTPPLLLLFVLAVTTAAVAPAASQSSAAEPRTIDVVARRYAFEPAEITVAQGERVRLRVRSADGLHGFQIEALDVREELLRGAEPVLIEFTAEHAGRFPILCSEYCGEGHEEMTGVLVVQARP